MPKKKISKKDAPLKAFIKTGGRAGAEADFNTILKRAVKPKDNKPSSTKSK